MWPRRNGGRMKGGDQARFYRVPGPWATFMFPV